jgi:hypothetical protein
MSKKVTADGPPICQSKHPSIPRMFFLLRENDDRYVVDDVLYFLT